MTAQLAVGAEATRPNLTCITQQKNFINNKVDASRWCLHAVLGPMTAQLAVGAEAHAPKLNLRQQHIAEHRK
jgi:hypothetical protein